MLIELAERTFPAEVAALTYHRFTSGFTSGLTVHEAKQLLCKVPVGWAQGMIVDGCTVPLLLSGEGLPDAFDPRPMHRQCFADVSNDSVLMALERPKWLDLITEWPDDLICEHCQKTTPPQEKVAERVRWNPPNQSRFTDDDLADFNPIPRSVAWALLGFIGAAILGIWLFSHHLWAK
jgi:hypothetical protein